MDNSLEKEDKKTFMIPFMDYHKIFFVLSSVLVIISIFSLSFKKLNFAVDFTGGLLIDISVNDNSKISLLRDNLSNKKINDFTVQNYDVGGIVIRISQNEIQNILKKNLTQAETVNFVKGVINDSFQENITYNKVDFVGPQIGKELITKSIIALVIACVAMLIYIAFRFTLDSGIGSIISLVHDAILMFGIYSVFRIDFDLLSVTSILTIIGYSVNDKVVIYDKIRELLLSKKSGTPLAETINLALNATLRRTLLTSSTTLISLLILSFFGGEVLKYFSLMVFLGIIIGTYSSIFISAPILIYFNKNNK